MSNEVTWVLAGLAAVVVVAAFIWVLRHRTDAELADAGPTFVADEVTITPTSQGPTGSPSEVISSHDGGIDQTVPLSRLGGAGWRDTGEGASTEATPSPYAGQPSSDPPSASGPTTFDFDTAPREDYSDTSDEDAATGEHHVSVDQTGPRPDVDEELDRRRGGHW